MPALSINDGGAWRKSKALWVHDGTAWRKVKAMWVNDGSAWRKVFAGFTPSGGFFSSDLVSTGVAPSVRFNSDGTVQSRDASNSYYNDGTWGDPPEAGAGADYWIKAEVQSGSGGGSLSGSIGTWERLNVVQVWTLSAPPFGSYWARTLTYQIASDAGGSNVVASGSISLSNDRT